MDFIENKENITCTKDTFVQRLIISGTIPIGSKCQSICSPTAIFGISILLHHASPNKTLVTKPYSLML